MNHIVWKLSLLNFHRELFWLLQLPIPQSRPGRRKDGSQSGCAGAYFEPTVSRHVASVEQASNVPCHVPGLSRHSTSGIMFDKVTVHFRTLTYLVMSPAWSKPPVCHVTCLASAGTAPQVLCWTRCPFTSALLPTLSCRQCGASSNVPCHVPCLGRHSTSGIVLDKVTVHLCILTYLVM